MLSRRSVFTQVMLRLHREHVVFSASA